MRDLKADLEICNKATAGPWNGKEDSGVEPVFETGCGCCTKSTLSKEDAEFIASAREGWPYAIGRAIKAEAEVRALRDIGKVTKDLISPLIINENETLKSELARYKRALELACEQISDYALPSGTESMKDKLAAGRYELFIKRATFK